MLLPPEMICGKLIDKTGSGLLIIRYNGRMSHSLKYDQFHWSARTYRSIITCSHKRSERQTIRQLPQMELSVVPTTGNFEMLQYPKSHNVNWLSV